MPKKVILATMDDQKSIPSKWIKQNKKPAKSWHWADVEKSDRLKRVVALLRDKSAYDGTQLARSILTTDQDFRPKFSAREISWFAMVNSGPSVLAELRKNGVEIKSENVKGKDGVYKVYWIEK